VEDDAAVSSSNIVRLTNADLKVICIGIFLWFPKPKLAQSMPQVPSRVRRTPIIGRTWVDISVFGCRLSDQGTAGGRDYGCIGPRLSP
jgi:hypothetical protein